MAKQEIPHRFIKFTRIRNALAPYVKKARASKYVYIKIKASDLLELDTRIREELGSYAEYIKEDEHGN